MTDTTYYDEIELAAEAADEALQIMERRQALEYMQAVSVGNVCVDCDRLKSECAVDPCSQWEPEVETPWY